MEIKIGMNVHDIFNRCWFKVTDVKDGIVYLSGYMRWKKIKVADFEALYNASPLNKKEE